jgi:hypothetical protein
MGIGLSLLLIAIGAILKWAVDVQTNGFDWNMIGVILMIVGAIGLVWSVVVVGAWHGDYWGHRHYDDRP